jgi:hypothetical protein
MGPPSQNLEGIEMLTEFMTNPIADVVQRLALVISIFIPILIATTEGIKSLFDLKGKAAQYTAIGVNLFFGSMIVFDYFIPGASKYIGVVIFMIILMVSPLGGYDLIPHTC